MPIDVKSFKTGREVIEEKIEGIPTGVPHVSDVYLRPSQINMFVECPREFYYSLMGYEEEFVGVAAQHGTIFHTQAQMFFDLINPREIWRQPSEDRLYGYFRSKLSSGTPIDDKLDNFARMETKRWAILKNEGRTKDFIPTFREKRMRSSRLRLECTTDRIEKLASGDYCVVDYKSGNYYQGLLSDLRRQLTVYALVANDTHLTPTPVTHICVFHAGNFHVMFEPVKKATVTALAKRIKQIRDALQQAYVKTDSNGRRYYNIAHFPKKIHADAFCAGICGYNGVCNK